jgi:FKBP-type peptidyl-prolyl cis-trans isomerase 2
VIHLEGRPPAPARRPVPLELTVGVDDPRLPGLGLALVGLAAGGRITVVVPATRAHGRYDPGRIYRLARSRLPPGRPVVVGQWLRMTDRRGRRRLVRILQADVLAVIVDNNHPPCRLPGRLEAPA